LGTTAVSDGNPVVKNNNNLLKNHGIFVKKISKMVLG
jgi:hypothetical protein